MSDRASVLQLASKEGFLTKQGWVVKNWKSRWFVLSKYDLSYYSDRNVSATFEDCLLIEVCEEGRMIRHMLELEFPSK